VSQPLGVSIVVVNYNNGRFLKAAIDSALAQDYPLCEVIVVDDCSNDNSRAVIAEYGDRIQSVLRQENGHQIVALNSAWPLARYPILMFLDSDDLLFPYAVSSVAHVWREETVKVQFPLTSIDKDGQPIGHVWPRYPSNLNTRKIRSELLRSGQSPSSPGSGNAYSQFLLEQVTRDGGFDFDNPRDYWMDNILECNAPFYGEIVTLNEPLASYRLHDGNLFLQSEVNPSRFSRIAQSFNLKLNYLARRCQRWGIRFDPTAAGRQSIWLLECRLSAAKLTHTNDPLYQLTPSIVYQGIKACMGDRTPMIFRIARMLWFVSVAAAPRGIAWRIIALRFVIGQRPRWLKRLMNIKASIGKVALFRGMRDPRAKSHGR
jgi:hypothetical protein